jgi:alpha-beta hydrolase superfamily lysophospholipase
MVDYGNALERLKKQYKSAGLTRIETKLYEGMRHELHNEPGQAEVFKDLIDWFDRQRDALEGQKSAA